MKDRALTVLIVHMVCPSGMFDLVPAYFARFEAVIKAAKELVSEGVVVDVVND